MKYETTHVAIVCGRFLDFEESLATIRSDASNSIVLVHAPMAL